VDIKAAMKNIETTIKECSKIFKDTMVIWASLQEDPNVLKIEVEICNKQ